MIRPWITSVQVMAIVGDEDQRGDHQRRVVGDSEQRVCGDPGGLELRHDVDAEGCHDQERHQNPNHGAGKPEGQKVGDGVAAEAAQLARHEDGGQREADHGACEQGQGGGDPLRVRQAHHADDRPAARQAGHDRHGVGRGSDAPSRHPVLVARGETPMPMQAARYASTRIRSTSMGSRYLPRRRPLKIHKVRIGETTINAAISQPESAMPRTSKPRQIGRNETAENTIRNTSADRSPPAIRKK
jgi:hypothetical protein